MYIAKNANGGESDGVSQVEMNVWLFKMKLTN